MIQQIRMLINEYIISLRQNITIESDVILSDRKLEYVLSKNNFMASLSILLELTYDFLVVEIESEKIISNKTLYNTSVADLLIQVKVDLEEFSELK